MLALLFDVNRDRYAVRCRDVVEVLPLGRVRALPGAPRGIAGVHNYHGVPVPVVDLTALLFDRPSRDVFSTRLIVVRYGGGDGGGGAAGRMLTLVAEHVTDTLRCEESDFVSAGVRSDAAPGLGRMATNEGGFVQLVDIAALVPPSIHDALVAGAEP